MPDDNRLWRLTPHVCRVCFARVLEHRPDDGGRIYRCSNCDAQAEGRTPAVLCACGMKFKTSGDAGVRCHVNPAPTPEFPNLITASQVVAAR